MRLYCLIPCFVLAACGDNRNGSHPDGPHPIDGAPDSPIDAAPDAPVGSGSRIWAVGDLITDTQLIATSFLDGAGPFGPANPPPVIVPAGGHVLQPKNTNLLFDSNGHKIAFIADATTAGQFDLL